MAAIRCDKCMEDICCSKKSVCLAAICYSENAVAAIHCGKGGCAAAIHYSERVYACQPYAAARGVYAWQPYAAAKKVYARQPYTTAKKVYA